jgi:hypothetical protein
MARLVTGILCAAMIVEVFVPVAASAQGATPDLSGVYYPYQPPRGGGPARGATPPAARGQRSAPPPPPTRSAPTGDLSNGRSPTAPSLTPEYMAKWEVIQKSRMSGSYEYDRAANCLPPGMPSMMGAAYGLEIMQGKDRITFFSEWLDALRRVYIDGRKPTQKILNDPTYAGYSTGHWEGDTLVVDTVALHPDSFIDNSSPHSENMTIKERIRFTSPGILEDRVTVTDPNALTKPWETVFTYKRAEPPNDQLREFACTEGLGRSPK